MRIKTGSSLKALTPVEQVMEYHNLTKHTLEKYANGPEFLDWELQPSPYRYFSDISRYSLPLDLTSIDIPYQSLYLNKASQPTFALNKQTLGAILGLSMGLSAHKNAMGEQWSVRCNPSSGNLHPTEAYIIVQNIQGLNDGVYHYLSEDHSLQQRLVPSNIRAETNDQTLFIALTSIHWREAWKYGERAFRYCQLDIGHMLASISYAAACLGWDVKILGNWSSENIANLCGTNREADFKNAEHEHADLILAISTRATTSDIDPEYFKHWITTGHWQGKANRLDKYPLYRWPVIAQIEQATEIQAVNNTDNQQQELPDLLLEENIQLAKHIIYGRRSAQRFDGQTGMSRKEFYHLLDKCLYRPDTLPWNTLADVFPMLTLLYVHRIDTLTPGLYILLNTGSSIDEVKAKFTSDFLWSKPTNCPAHLPLYLLANSKTEKAAKTISCHQAIASDGAFSLSMLFKFSETISEHSMNYRKLYWQAGVLGQLLYLEAESLGLRGTGIGCFFDDVIHTLLGISDMEYQVLYNFTLGGALDDPRISILPAYPHLEIGL